MFLPLSPHSATFCYARGRAARERVRSALIASGLALPARRITVNLAPADLPKEGSHFDLPITLAVLAAMEVVPREDLCGYAALGELSQIGRAHV